MQEEIMKVLQDLDSQRISVGMAYNEIQKQLVAEATRLKGLDFNILHKSGIRVLDCKARFEKPDEIIDIDFGGNNGKD